jgi:hypothetical protein
MDKQMRIFAEPTKQKFREIPASTRAKFSVLASAKISLGLKSTAECQLDISRAIA